VRSQRIRVITKQRRFAAAGRRGMCCAPSSIRVSSWLLTPMQLVGRPKLARPLPKALPRTAVQALLATVARDEGSKRQTDRAERDLALILTVILAGLRSEELRPRGHWRYSHHR
jgi:integrase